MFIYPISRSETIVSEEIPGESSLLAPVMRTLRNTWGLLLSTDPKPLRPYNFEWHLNLGLLMPVYKRTEDTCLKERIGFLALQYLARASQINLDDLSSMKNPEVQNLYQLGLFQESATYHRSSTIYEPYLIEAMNKAFVPESSNQFILTDTVDFQCLLPLYFQTAPIPMETEDQVQAWSQFIASAVREYTGSKEGFFHFMEPPLLFDFTPFVAASIHSGADQFVHSMERLEKTLEEAIALAVESQLKDVDLDPEKLKAFIRANAIAICRTEVQSVPVVKILPLFQKAEFFSALSEDSQICGSSPSETFEGHGQFLARFVNLTGLRLGAVRARESLFRLLDFEVFLEKHQHLNGGSHKEVMYAPKGANALYFEDKQDLLRMALFKNFEKMAADAPPERALLILATVDIIRGMLNEITEEKWEELNQHPDTRELLQNFLVRLTHHMTKSAYEIEDFAHFTTSLELLFSEVASILALASPFHPGDFEGIYKPNLEHIPENLRPLVKTGVAKSAMHIFAGALSAAARARGEPKAQTAMMPGIYHEQQPFVGEENTLAEVLKNPSITRVDLFVGEFNPNIEKDLSHTVYHARDPIGDVAALLTAKPETERLTVVLDSTIDFVRSDKAGAFLAHYSKEIEEGRLNVLFIRSGQKFDMLGMDNYYGSPFYMVNNGDSYWQPFNALVQEEAFQTDPLSMQWFCLANRYAFEHMEAYRERIFTNTRSILEQIPEGLKPGNNPDIQVSLFEEGIDPCFIDIKLTGDLKAFRRVQNAFLSTFIGGKRKVYSKPGFGFLSPNFLPFADSQGAPRIIRINPGLDPADADLLIETLNKL